MRKTGNEQIIGSKVVAVVNGEVGNICDLWRAVGQLCRVFNTIIFKLATDLVDELISLQLLRLFL